MSMRRPAYWCLGWLMAAALLCGAAKAEVCATRHRANVGGPTPPGEKHACWRPRARRGARGCRRQYVCGKASKGVFRAREGAAGGNEAGGRSASRGVGKNFHTQDGGRWDMAKECARFWWIGAYRLRRAKARLNSTSAPTAYSSRSHGTPLPGASRSSADGSWAGARRTPRCLRGRASA